MHDDVLAALGALASVQLVAALRDERLGFSASDQLFVFVPDLHLISHRRLVTGQFKYATNETDLLRRVALTLTELRGTLRPKDLIVCQVGDFLDLWREAPSNDHPDAVAAIIRKDHDALVGALMSDELGTQFILGNHDFDLYKCPAYRAADRRLYFSNTEREPAAGILLHGDYFDWVERLPDQLQDLAVYLFAPGNPEPSRYLGQMRELVVESHLGRDYTPFIQARFPAPIGTLGPSDAIPTSFNVQGTGAPKENLLFLESAAAECRRANKDYAGNVDLRLAVIGHTHHARIAVMDNPFFVLVDCGAWIEKCTDGKNTWPNAQIAVLGQNEARIYQLRPLA
jgi:UDP-2,3-diacylglucosamine pyrophosphatase LpxH